MTLVYVNPRMLSIFWLLGCCFWAVKSGIQFCWERLIWCVSSLWFCIIPHWFPSTFLFRTDNKWRFTQAACNIEAIALLTVFKTLPHLLHVDLVFSLAKGDMYSNIWCEILISSRYAYLSTSLTWINMGDVMLNRYLIPLIQFKIPGDKTYIMFILAPLFATWAWTKYDLNLF